MTINYGASFTVSKNIDFQLLTYSNLSAYHAETVRREYAEILDRNHDSLGHRIDVSVSFVLWPLLPGSFENIYKDDILPFFLGYLTHP